MTDDHKAEPLDLDAIAYRIRDCSTYNFGLRNADRLAKEDAPALLAALKEAQAGLADAWQKGAEHIYEAGERGKCLFARDGDPCPHNPYINRTETP